MVDIEGEEMFARERDWCERASRCLALAYEVLHLGAEIVVAFHEVDDAWLAAFH